MEDSYLGMLHDDHYSEHNCYGSQVYIPAASPGPSTVQFVHPYVNRPNTNPYANLPITGTSYGTVGVERIEGRKKQEYEQQYAEATYSIEEVKDHM